jgi:hypothetical protein
MSGIVHWLVIAGYGSFPWLVAAVYNAPATIATRQV